MLNKLERHASARINHVLSRIRDHHSTELDINHVVLQSSFLPKKKDFPLIFELDNLSDKLPRLIIRLNISSLTFFFNTSIIALLLEERKSRKIK